LKTTDMTRGNPAKLMLQFAFPVILTNLGQQLYMIVDAAIVGRGVGVDALAAVGCTDWTYWVILWAVSVMTQGFATFVARYFGKQDHKMMNKSITMSALLSLAIAVTFTVAGLVFARPVLTLLETPAHILDDATTYLSTMIAGTLIVTGYNLAAAVLRAFGDGKSPLIAMIIAAVLNILLDLLFVMVFKWGVFGAALASIMSQMVAFLFCVVKILKIECVKLDKEAWQWDGKLFMQLLLFGLPLAVQYVVINVGGMIVQSTINLQGSSFIAGYTSVSKLYGMLEATAIAMGAAFTTFCSQNYGAGNYVRVRKGVKTCTYLALGAAAVIMAIVLPLRSVLPQLFIDSAEAGAVEALAVSVRYLTIMVLWLPVLYMVYVYRSQLQSMGDSMWSMISGFGESAVRIVMGKVIVLWLGSSTLFYVEPFSWLAACLFVLVPYYCTRDKMLPKEDRPAKAAAAE